MSQVDPAVCDHSQFAGSIHTDLHNPSTDGRSRPVTLRVSARCILCGTPVTFDHGQYEEGLLRGMLSLTGTPAVKPIASAEETPEIPNWA